MDMTAMNVSFAEDVVSIMEERGITEDDVRAVLAWAEGEGGKLIDSDERKYLGKKRLENVTVYVLYSIQNEEITVFSAYSHRVTFRKDA